MARVINIIDHKDCHQMIDSAKEWYDSSDKVVLGNGVVREGYNLGQPIGWMNNIFNRQGWVLYKLSNFDIANCIEAHQNTSNVFRYCTYDGNLGLIKIKLVKSIDIFTREESWKANIYFLDSNSGGEGLINFETKPTNFITLNIRIED